MIYGTAKPVPFVQRIFRSSIHRRRGFLYLRYHESGPKDKSPGWRVRMLGRREFIRIAALAATAPRLKPLFAQAAQSSPGAANATQGMASRGVKAGPRLKGSGVPFRARFTDVAAK